MTKDEAIKTLCDFARSTATSGFAPDIKLTVKQAAETLDPTPAPPEPQVLQWDSTPGRRPDAPSGCVWLRVCRYNTGDRVYVYAYEKAWTNIGLDGAVALIKLPEGLEETNND